MSDGTPSTPNEDAPLEAWRQGDFASDAGGFLFAKPSAGGYPYDAKELTEGIVGLVIISQTCDIVRRTGERHYVAVCPLITVDEADVADWRSVSIAPANPLSRRPGLAGGGTCHYRDRDIAAQAPTRSRARGYPQRTRYSPGSDHVARRVQMGLAEVHAGGGGFERG